MSLAEAISDTERLLANAAERVARTMEIGLAVGGSPTDGG
jgi:hypothetical protein